MAFDTTARVIPQNKPGGIDFTPSLRAGTTNIEDAGGTYNTRGGIIWYPYPGVVHFVGLVVLSLKGSATGDLSFRLPTTDADGNTIPFPRLTGVQVVRVFNLSSLAEPIKAVTGQHVNGTLSIELHKRIGFTDGRLNDTEITNAFVCQVQGLYFYTP